MQHVYWNHKPIWKYSDMFFLYRKITIHKSKSGLKDLKKENMPFIFMNTAT